MLHACWHADFRRCGLLHTPIDSSSISATSQLFSPLFCSSGRKDHTLGAPLSHSKTLDNAESNSSNCSLAACSSSLPLKHLRCPHFVATCGPASKPNCHGCGPKTPRRSCSTRSCRLSHSFWRLSKMLRQIFNNLQASLQDTYNNRQHMIA